MSNPENHTSTPATDTEGSRVCSQAKGEAVVRIEDRLRDRLKDRLRDRPRGRPRFLENSPHRLVSPAQAWVLRGDDFARSLCA